MARKTNHRFEKQKREEAAQERSAARRERKQQRIKAAARAGSGGEDPDLAGIVVGPQPREVIPEEVAARAVARAMYPGRPLPGQVVGPEPATRLFVGNVDFGVNVEELRSFFKDAGFETTEITVVEDRETGRPRGFAFVEIAGRSEAARAIAAMNGTELAGRSLRLSLADAPGRR